MPATVNERAALRTTLFKRNGPAIPLLANARTLERLFADNEVGFAYDPNGLTAEKINWRRNRLTYSEDFTNPIWLKTQARITTSTVTPPAPMLAAYKITEDTSTAIHQVRQTFQSKGGTEYTTSVHFHTSSTRNIVLRVRDFSGDGAESYMILNPADGTILTKGSTRWGYAASVISVGDGWFRAVLKVTPDVTATLGVDIFPASGATLASGVYQGDNISFVCVSGAQLDLGQLSEYQRITDFNTDFIRQYPTHALYQDSLGSIPVTARDQPTGLFLDKSKGLVLGNVIQRTNARAFISSGGAPDPSLIDHGDGSYTVAHGSVLRISFGSSASLSNKWVAVEVEKLEGNANSGVAAIVMDWVDTNPSFQSAATASRQLYKFICFHNKTAESSFLDIFNNTGSPQRFKTPIVRELAGNHAYQTASASRPVLRQTPILGNELVINGEFTNDTSAWTGMYASVSIVNGAVKVQNSLNKSDEQINQSIFSSVAPNKTYQLSCSVKDVVGTDARILIDTQNKSLLSPMLASAKSYTFTFTVPSDATSCSVRLRAPSIAGQYIIFDNVSVKEITGYRTDQNYLEFDGVDDFLQTNNIDFTSTDKVSLFAGVRKLSDANTGVLCELGADSVSNNGSFGMFAPASSGASKFQFMSRAVSASYAVTTDIQYSAPCSAVICGQGDAAKSKAMLRANGTVVGSIIGADTSQKYANYPLYIGRRVGTSLPFNGHLYSLIGIGRLTTDSETTSLEKSIAKNVGVTL